MKALRNIVAAVVLLGSGGACRVFRYEEFNYRDQCVQWMPLLHERPERPHRIVKVIEKSGEDDLVYEACAERADAVVSLGVEETTDNVVTGTSIPVGSVVVHTARQSKRERLTVRGLLIRYTTR